MFIKVSQTFIVLGNYEICFVTRVATRRSCLFWAYALKGQQELATHHGENSVAFSTASFRRLGTKH